MQSIFWPIGCVLIAALLSRAHITLNLKIETTEPKPESLPDSAVSSTDQEIFDEEQKTAAIDVTQRVQALFLEPEVNAND